MPFRERQRRLRTALVFRDRTCVVPGCHMPYGLEIDHVHPLSLGGPTELDNLALLSRFDFVFKNFNSAASYSGPAAIRVLRADCGQPTHKGARGRHTVAPSSITA